MKRMQFKVWLEQPLVISEQAASAGAHQSLDYLPGANFLGVAAGQLYDQLSADQAFMAFHSGQVRFGDGLPTAGGEAGLPVPLSWHVFKGESATQETVDGQVCFAGKQVFDPAQDDPNPKASEGRQPQQLRGGYVTASGRKLQPAREQTLKTAIDPETGSAQDSQLFGYQAIAPGQSFCFELQADDEVDETLWQQLQQALTGTARLGRSRSAQFGRVTIKPVSADSALLERAESSTELILWLTSDLLLQAAGQPCLQPRPELLGLPEDSQWLESQSFLRSRRYSRYNGFRRHYDSERQVISRGSVLRFNLPEPPSSELLARLAAGIGRRQAEGLGQAIVNPALLTGRHPAFARASAAQTKPAETRPTQDPGTLLTSILQQRADQVRDGEAVAEQARHIFDGLCDQIRRIRAYYALPVGQPLEAAPGRSQWGVLKSLANQYRNQPGELKKQLMGQETGVLRNRTHVANQQDRSSGGVENGWHLKTGTRAEDRLGDWLIQQLDKVDNKHLPAVVGQLAGHGMSPAWTRCCLGRASRVESKGETA